MDSQNGAIFKVVGFVKRKFVSPAGKFAKVTLDVPRASGGETHVDVRSFGKDGLIGAIGKLEMGQRVQFTGTIEKQVLTSRDKKEVVVDGYKAWVEVLTATKMEAEAKNPTAVGGLDDSDKPGW